MNQVVNRLMTVLMVVGSIIAVTTYAEERLTSLNQAQLPPSNSTGSHLPTNPNVVSTPSVTSHNSVNPIVVKAGDAVSYQEKKAVVIRSYQLQDPRAQASRL